MPTCYTLIGPPCCGKSTWVRNNRASMDDPQVISTDDYIEEIAKQQNKLYHEIFSEIDFSELEKRGRAEIARAVIAQRDIVLDQTNYTVGRRMLFRKSIPESYEMVGVVFSFDYKELIARTFEREAATGKRVPPFVIDRMVRDYEAPSENEFSRLIYV